NSVWFWGGGTLPDIPSPRSFDLVYSMDAVSSGLTHLTGGKLKPLKDVVTSSDLIRDLPGSTLVDWAVPLAADEDTAWVCTPDRLESFCGAALASLKRRGGLLQIHSPEKSWRLQSRQLWRIWRRPRPLAD